MAETVNKAKAGDGAPGVQVTERDLLQDLVRLGVEPGDVLWMHSSFRSVGPVEGGAGAVIRAMEAAVGPEGLLLLPAFNLVAGGNAGRAASWDIRTSPSTVGWLTEYFRTLPGTVRSDHFSHSVAARGPGAAAFVGEHLSTEGMASPWDMAPWGNAYGKRSPMIKAYHHPRGKLLMLGVDYHSSTYCHVVEVTSWHGRRQRAPEAEYYWVNREKAGEYWDSLGRMKRGKVGGADCRLFSIRAYVDALLDLSERDPGRLFTSHPANAHPIEDGSVS